MRVVFMGSPEFALPSLEMLLLHCEVVAVYTQPDRQAGRGRHPAMSSVKRLALARGLPVMQPPSLRPPQEAERLADLGPDVIVVAAYGQLLPRGVLGVPAHACLNVHPSLLPRHRGPSPVAAAILAGDEFTGVTIMLMDEGLDTGPILAQSRLAIADQDTKGSLTTRLAELGAQLLGQTLPLWLQGEIHPQPQDEKEATYSRVITKEQGEIDWHLPAREIARRVRAFEPWPGCYTWWGGRRLKVMEAVPLGTEGGLQPGRMMALGRGVGVETGEGILGLRRVQLEGRRAMSAEEFARGQRDWVGRILPDVHP